MTAIRIPDHLSLEVIDVKQLSDGWNSGSLTDETRMLGAAWAAELRGCVLRVPSAVLPEEHCFLLNPAHPEFAGIVFEPARPFRFDQRLRPGTASDTIDR